MFLNAADSAADSKISKWLKFGEFYVAGILLVASLLILRQLTKSKMGLRLPPGPKALPIIGNIHQLASTLPHHALTRMSQRYGPLIFLRMGGVHCIVVSSSEMAREVMKTQDQIFASRPRNIMGEVFNYDHSGIVWAPLGETHRRLRKACVTELFAPSKLAEFQDVRREEFAYSTKIMFAQSQEGKLIDMEHIIIPAFFNNATRLFYTKSFYGKNASSDTSPDEAKKFQKMIVDLAAVGLFVIGEFIPFLRWMDLSGSERQLKRLQAEFDGFLNNILKEHRSKVKNATDKQDIVDVLLGLQKEKDEVLALTDDRIKGVLQDLLIAGVETGSNQTLWTLTELMRHPEVMRNLQAEIDSVVGKDRLVAESDLIHFKYLKAVIKESFRLHPVAPLLVPRESVKATTIAGYDIPEKTRVYVNAYAIGRDAQIWDSPLEFNPDRFLNRSIELGGQSFELLPFGSGRRICVGINLGLLMVESTIASWVHAFDFSLPPGMKPTDVDCEETLGLTACKKFPLHVHVSKRLSTQAYKELDLFL